MLTRIADHPVNRIKELLPWNDKIAGKITSRGGKVVLPKFAVPGVCWQGYFLDPEGNTFGIFRPDPKAK